MKLVFILHLSLELKLEGLKVKKTDEGHERAERTSVLPQIIPTMSSFMLRFWNTDHEICFPSVTAIPLQGKGQMFHLSGCPILGKTVSVKIKLLKLPNAIACGFPF